MKATGITIFMIVFFISMLVAFYLPDLPPGRELAGFLGINIAEYTDTGIPMKILLVGFSNGIIYGGTALLIYTLARSVPAILSRDEDH